METEKKCFTPCHQLPPARSPVSLEPLGGDGGGSCAEWRMCVRFLRAASSRRGGKERYVRFGQRKKSKRKRKRKKKRLKDMNQDKQYASHDSADRDALFGRSNLMFSVIIH
jgi:hypothetical protein